MSNIAAIERGRRSRAVQSARDALGQLTSSRPFLSIAFVLPALLVLGFVLAYPIVRTLALSLTDYNLLQPNAGITFIGLENFVWIARNQMLWATVWTTTLLTVVVVVLEVVVGMGIALLLSEPFRGSAIIRSVFILPWAIPTVVVAFLFRMYFSPRYGLLNQSITSVAQALGLVDQQFTFLWLGEQSTALVAVALVIVWKGLPFVVLVFLGALQAIPRETGEAARIDGASALQEFRYITLPSLGLVVLIVIIFRVISTFNGFDVVFLLTGGGPENATRVLAVEVFNRAFVTYQIGRAAAITTLMLVVLSAMTYCLLRLRRHEEIG